MKLATYLTRTKTTHQKLADKIGVFQSQVTRWATGVHTPSLKNQQRIQRATRGKVKIVKDWPN